ncbi:MAG: beta-glucanase/beta-glucan synthetase [Bacteroidetes bacterium GWE2_41_25]|nr:MAG: beta-glucanase/beta-glucan synthetase [Bacteroidetes bacterium GWA2_40_15]OFX96432.1 MAG: beta-glucanase/beta-glucan synthetase [Bacteroidetes bacterium GWE2_41_25]OFY58689.1 MAG: beta-glucanase/beta-glucan synthetase [Bacteroidetes bacterium GWF2_41_9]HAM10076.1 beta-glucanase/beta-glucan synthetase [Bacteroidales bacterium]HCU18723.1 beta-glucanase/beta-glucan synthetase [Bacteroidales bacterium]
MKHLLSLAVIIVAGLSACTQKERYHDTFVEDFSSSSSKIFKHNTFGDGDAFRYAYGVESPSEKGTKVLSFRIDPEGPAGAGKGPEVISKNFTHFGTYTARLKVPDIRDIQPDAGVVVGYFTYHMDSDPGLSEIDWEWLIADPEVIYVGTWTGPRGDLRRIGRTINMAKGIIYNTSYRENLSGVRRQLTGIQSQPDTIPAIEGYDASSQFYTYGFDWHPDRIRWWLIHPVTADTVVLWDYKGSLEGIPQNKTHYRMNFWHTNNWPVETNPNSIEKPLHPYELEIDWMSYDPLKK